MTNVIVSKKQRTAVKLWHVATWNWNESTTNVSQIAETQIKRNGKRERKHFS